MKTSKPVKSNDDDDNNTIGINSAVSVIKTVKKTVKKKVKRGTIKIAANNDTNEINERIDDKTANLDSDNNFEDDENEEDLINNDENDESNDENDHNNKIFDTTPNNEVSYDANIALDRTSDKNSVILTTDIDNDFTPTIIEYKYQVESLKDFLHCGSYFSFLYKKCILIEDPSLYSDLIDKLKKQSSSSEEEDSEEKFNIFIKELESIDYPCYMTDDELKVIGISKFLFESLVDYELCSKTSLYWSSWYQFVELVDFGLRYDLVKLQSFR